MNVSTKLTSLGWHLGAALIAVTLGASPSFAQAEAAEDISAPMANATPQNGFWVDPNFGSGRSVILEVVASTGELFASTLVYDDSGRAVWYVINSVPNVAVPSAQLQQFAGGQSLNSNFRAPAFIGSMGTAVFTFDTTTTGTISLPGGVVMNIHRLNLVAGGAAAGPSAGAPANGWWYNASESGRGFFLESQSGTMMFSALEYNDLGQATWYYARGAMTTATTFTGSLIEPFGGQTLNGANSTATQNYPRGTVTIQFSSSTTGTITEPSGRQTAIVRYGF